MKREEAILLMNDVVNHINRELGKSNNLTDSQIDEAITNHQEGLSYINGILYDELYQRGVISQY
jgi:hypothetical protein